MKYFYNYSFLDKWMEANSKITNREIMKAMGTTSNACLDSWIRMKSPLPTIAMLRFCNAFHVPLSAFIVDADKDQQGREGCCEEGYVCPGIDDQFEPDGGYLDNEEKRKQGTRALRNPLDVERMKSNRRSTFCFNWVQVSEVVPIRVTARTQGRAQGRDCRCAYGCCCAYSDYGTGYSSRNGHQLEDP